MEKEINEILDGLKNYLIEKEEDYKDGCVDSIAIDMYYDEIKTIVDYIINLQEENEDLREENKEAHDFDETLKDIKDNLIARINRQECEIHNLKAKLEMYENGVYFSSENDKLQERIDKAIEYIKQHIEIDSNGILTITHTFDKCNMKELFDILEGSDKE